ncbi:hypothetical protein V2J09_001945 [Rumex salicifolius]
MVGEEGKLMRLGNYEIGRILGQGNFGKVKLAKHLLTGEFFAVKILHKDKILHLKITDQIKREISTLKILKHPHIVRLYEVLASKTKIYMIFEYVNDGELFNKISAKGKLLEKQGRRFFQQLIDAVSYCHEKGVFHRDLKLENILVDAKGNIKVSDFGLSALPQHLREDGLLHTTCGSPNYVAPEILANRGYCGAAADIWSCGYFPFDDRNRVVLYHKIAKGDVQIPTCLSPGAQNLLKRILEPNPTNRITIKDIKSHQWFTEEYTPCNPEEEEDNLHIDEDVFSMNEDQSEGETSSDIPKCINAFQLISMSSFLDLSGFFEQEDAFEREIRFTSNLSHRVLLERIEETGTGMGFCILKKKGKLKLVLEKQGHKGPGSLYVAVEVFEISSSLYVVELRKSYGDGSAYRQLCRKLSNDLGAPQKEQFLPGQ